MKVNFITANSPTRDALHNTLAFRLTENQTLLGEKNKTKEHNIVMAYCLPSKSGNWINNTVCVNTYDK